MGFEIKEATITSAAGGWGTATISNCQGYIAAIEVNPSAVSVPTASFDIEVDNANGLVIHNKDDYSATATTMTCPPLGTYYKFPVAGTLTVYGADMGSAKVAQVIIYLDNY